MPQVVTLWSWEAFQFFFERFLPSRKDSFLLGYLVSSPASPLLVFLPVKIDDLFENIRIKKIKSRARFLDHKSTFGKHINNRF